MPAFTLLADGGSHIVHPCAAVNDELVNLAQGVGKKSGVSAFHIIETRGKKAIATNFVRASLAVYRQVAVCEVVAGQAIMSDDLDAFENHDGKAWSPTHAEVVGSYTGGISDRFFVASESDVRALYSPIVVIAMPGASAGGIVKMGNERSVANVFVLDTLSFCKATTGCLYVNARVIPPVDSFEHSQGPRGTELAGCRLRLHKQWVHDQHVHAKRLVDP